MKILKSLNKLATFLLIGAILAYLTFGCVTNFLDECNVSGPVAQNCVYQGIDYSHVLTALGWFLALSIPATFFFKLSLVVISVISKR